MSRPSQSIHGQWSSRWAFILAATGSAVGLGNIWKFPYITGEYGGGAFVLVYLACLVVIGLPVMMAEIMVGRRGRQNPANGRAIYIYDVCVVDEADTYRTPRFNQRQLTLSDSSK